jgi:hypothetical protein
MAAMVVFASCASAGGTSEGDDCISRCGSKNTSVDCRHIKLKSVMGIDDEILKNTNRFPLAATKHRYIFNLDNPIYGFAEVCVFLNGRDQESVPRNMPHRLRSVIFMKEIASDLNLEKEYKALCGAIADFLKVKMPEVRLAEGDNSIKKGYSENMCRSSVGFMLGNNQFISVAAYNPRYVLRDGQPVLSTKARVEIGVTYNAKLSWDGIDKFKCEKVDVVRDLDFGFDCSEALSKAMKSSIKKTVRRKDVKGRNVRKKADKKGVGK